MARRRDKDAWANVADDAQSPAFIELRSVSMTYSPPKAHGLYDPQFEHDACGIGAVVNISGRREHGIIEYGKQVLLNLQHRGAAGADESTGDGAGILFQFPHEFFAAEAGRLGLAIPGPGRVRRGHGVPAAGRRGAARRASEILGDGDRRGRAGGLAVGGTCPTDDDCLGDIARAAEPVIRQVFIDGEGLDDEDLERRLFVVRKRAEHRVRASAGRGGRRFLRRLDVVPHDRATRGCSSPRSCSRIIRTWPTRGC